MIFTTSRKACRKTIQLSKDLSKSFPASFYWSRGKKSIEELVGASRYEGAKALIVVVEENGNPSSLRLISIAENSWGYEKETRIALVKLRKDLGFFKSKISSLKKGPCSKELESLLGLIEFSDDSKNVLSEEKGVLFFYRNGKEIGPRLKLVK